MAGPYEVVDDDDDDCHVLLSNPDTARSTRVSLGEDQGWVTANEDAEGQLDATAGHEVCDDANYDAGYDGDSDVHDRITDDGADDVDDADDADDAGEYGDDGEDVDDGEADEGQPHIEIAEPTDQPQPEVEVPQDRHQLDGETQHVDLSDGGDQTGLARGASPGPDQPPIPHVLEVQPYKPGWRRIDVSQYTAYYDDDYDRSDLSRYTEDMPYEFSRSSNIALKFEDTLHTNLLHPCLAVSVQNPTDVEWPYPNMPEIPKYVHKPVDDIYVGILVGRDPSRVGTSVYLRPNPGSGARTIIKPGGQLVSPHDVLIFRQYADRAYVQRLYQRCVDDTMKNDARSLGEHAKDLAVWYDIAAHLQYEWARQNWRQGAKIFREGIREEWFKFAKDHIEETLERIRSPGAVPFTKWYHGRQPLIKCKEFSTWPKDFLRKIKDVKYTMQPWEDICHDKILRSLGNLSPNARLAYSQLICFALWVLSQDPEERRYRQQELDRCNQEIAFRDCLIIGAHTRRMATIMSLCQSLLVPEYGKLDRTGGILDRMNKRNSKGVKVVTKRQDSHDKKAIRDEAREAKRKIDQETKTRLAALAQAKKDQATAKKSAQSPRGQPRGRGQTSAGRGGAARSSSATSARTSINPVTPTTPVRATDATRLSATGNDSSPATKKRKVDSGGALPTATVEGSPHAASSASTGATPSRQQSGSREKLETAGSGRTQQTTPLQTAHRQSHPPRADHQSPLRHAASRHSQSPPRHSAHRQPVQGTSLTPIVTGPSQQMQHATPRRSAQGTTTGSTTTVTPGSTARLVQETTPRRSAQGTTTGSTTRVTPGSTARLVQEAAPRRSAQSTTTSSTTIATPRSTARPAQEAAPRRSAQSTTTSSTTIATPRSTARPAQEAAPRQSIQTIITDPTTTATSSSTARPAREAAPRQSVQNAPDTQYHTTIIQDPDPFHPQFATTMATQSAAESESLAQTTAPTQVIPEAETSNQAPGNAAINQLTAIVAMLAERFDKLEERISKK